MGSGQEPSPPEPGRSWKWGRLQRFCIVGGKVPQYGESNGAPLCLSTILHSEWGVGWPELFLPARMTNNSVRQVKLSLCPCYFASRLNPPVYLKEWQCLGQASSVFMISLNKYFTLCIVHGTYSLISWDHTCLRHNVIKKCKSYFKVLLCMHTVKWEGKEFW